MQHSCVCIVQQPPPPSPTDMMDRIIDNAANPNPRSSHEHLCQSQATIHNRYPLRTNACSLKKPIFKKAFEIKCFCLLHTKVTNIIQSVTTNIDDFCRIIEQKPRQVITKQKFNDAKPLHFAQLCKSHAGKLESGR